MLKVGDMAPDFRRESDAHGQCSLAGLKGKRAVLYFYPKDDTSGCTTEALEFQERLDAFAALDVMVLGISKDSVKSHSRFREKYGLTFPLLSDSEHEMLEAYEAWGEKKMYGKAVVGTIRTTVVVNREGIIDKVYRNVRAKGHAQKVLDDLING